MLKNFFSRVRVEIRFNRNRQDDTIDLIISSEVLGARKESLYVDEKRIGKDLEDFWKSIKTKNLLVAALSFTPIDYYSNETNMFDTPKIVIKRGLKKAKYGSDTHGSIPKGWEAVGVFRFKDMKKNTPIFEVLNATVSHYLSLDNEKEIAKQLKPFLQKKQSSVWFRFNG